MDQVDASKLAELKLDYCRAHKYWRVNSLRMCLQICDQLGRDIRAIIKSRQYEPETDDVLRRLKTSVWFLKLKCLADEYHVNESLLFNEEDLSISNDIDRVQTFAGGRRSDDLLATPPTATIRRGSSAYPMTAATGRRTTRTSAAIVTGRMPSANSSRQSATSSYRPLTTSLTATQTAFSRSTRPLLKYSTCKLLSRPIYEYLYSAQSITNRCPDYRQCLEYLTSVQNTKYKQMNEQRQELRQDSDIILNLDEDEQLSERLRSSLEVVWLLAFGVCYFKLKMNKQATEYFHEARKKNNSYLDPYTWLIKIYLRLGQPIKVLQTCQDGLQHCNSPILYNWMARVQSLVYDSYLANRSLTKSLELFPTNIEALANVGHFAFYSDKFDVALKCFDRIYQLSSNQLLSLATSDAPANGLATVDESNLETMDAAESLNNLALCHFKSGNLQNVLPLFQRALMCSPNKLVTSDIWYNISFVSVACGLKNMSIACLRLALENNSQNHEARNNLGVLKYERLLNCSLHFKNKHEYWSGSDRSPGKAHSMLMKMSSPSDEQTEDRDSNSMYQRELASFYNEVETYFSLAPAEDEMFEFGVGFDRDQTSGNKVPEMLYNMALVKWRRGQLLAAVRFCKMYLEFDQNNYTIHKILDEVRQLIFQDT